MTLFQIIFVIFWASLIIGIIILKVLSKKGYIEESPKPGAFLLLGFQIGLCLFASFSLPSFIIYWVINGMNDYFDPQIKFQFPAEMYLFSLTVSILALHLYGHFYAFPKSGHIKVEIAEIHD